MPDPQPHAGYSAVSMRPMQILAFLAPLIAAYEYGSVRYLSDSRAGVVETIRAHKMLADFFHAFGVVGLFLPGLALICVLLAWHIATRNKWTVSPSALVIMAIESCLWTAPLFVASVIIPDAVQAGLTHPPLAGGDDLERLSRPALLTISLGAGLYEELLFRLIAITLLHALLVDVLGIEDGVGRTVAVLLGALAFTLYHGVPNELSPATLGRMVFYFTAGVYFGIVFLLRGFGIVVATHAIYDALVLVLLK